MTKDKQTNTAQTNHALPQGWREVRLGGVIEIFNGKSRPKQVGKYPVYGGNGILGYSDKYNTEGDTIIIGRVGAYCGSVYFEKSEFWLSDNALGVKNKLEISDIKFLYFLLKSINLNKKSIGGAQPLLTQKIIKELKILLPPLPTQKAIAKVLSAFDDKIELLREQNETLEQIGQTLFKEWFGKYSPSRPDDLPEGWRVGKITEIIERKTISYRCNKDDLSDKGKTPILDQGETGLYGYTEREPDFIATKDDPVLIFTNHTCNYWFIDYPFCAIQNVIPYKGKNGYDEYFLYFLTKGSVTFKEYKGHWPDFVAKDFVIPPVEKAKEFSEIAKPLLEKISDNNRQIQTLTRTRDTLLPKLMKGEVLV